MCQERRVEVKDKTDVGACLMDHCIEILLQFVEVHASRMMITQTPTGISGNGSRNV